MSAIKRILPIFASVAMAMSLFGCSNKEEDSVSTGADATDGSTSEAVDNADTDTSEDETDIEDATVQADIPLEYDGTDVNDGCADTINKYFTAIINQKYEDYKATIDPYYFQVYNSWLDGNYGYGMETSFELMHQNLMDSAASANNGNDVTNVLITKMKLNKTVAQEDEDESVIIEDYLMQYDSVIGEGFSEELMKQCDDIINITFTMTANCDGTELEILQDMELLMTVHGDEYKILG